MWLGGAPGRGRAMVGIAEGSEGAVRTIGIMLVAENMRMRVLLSILLAGTLAVAQTAGEEEAHSGDRPDQGFQHDSVPDAMGERVEDGAWIRVCGPRTCGPIRS